MKQSPSSKRGRSSRTVEALIELAEGISASGSRAEDIYWNKRLEDEINNVFSEFDETSLNAALDKLSERESRAHEELADAIEGCVEFERIYLSDNTYDSLLFTCPILAWSLSGLDNFKIKKEVLDQFSCLLRKFVFNDQAFISLTDYLFSPDQLPETFIETKLLKKEITESLLKKKHFSVLAKDLKQTTRFLADQRHILGVVAVPSGTHIFKWQNRFSEKKIIESAWKKEGGGLVGKIMPQCAKESMLPKAYYVGCREADRSSRGFSVKASVSYLDSSLSLTSDSLFVVIGGCYDRHLEEYRISFCDKKDLQVVHGIIWPLLGPEDEFSELVDTIEETLRKEGVLHIKTLSQRLPLEFCDKCETPLYPNSEGEMVHIESLDSDSMQPVHIH